MLHTCQALQYLIRLEFLAATWSYEILSKRSYGVRVQGSIEVSLYTVWVRGLI